MTTHPTHALPLAKDVMTRDPICVSGSDSARELAELLDGNEISGVPVLDVEERVIGVVSRTDLLRRCVEGPMGIRQDSSPSDWLELGGHNVDDSVEALGTVEDFMTPDPIMVAADTPLSEVTRTVLEERVHRVVVVDSRGRPVGIITSLDLVEAAARVLGWIRPDVRNHPPA